MLNSNWEFNISYVNKFNTLHSRAMFTHKTMDALLVSKSAIYIDETAFCSANVTYKNNLWMQNNIRYNPKDNYIFSVFKKCIWIKY